MCIGTPSHIDKKNKKVTVTPVSSYVTFSLHGVLIKWCMAEMSLIISFNFNIIVSNYISL